MSRRFSIRLGLRGLLLLLVVAISLIGSGTVALAHGKPQQTQVQGSHSHWVLVGTYPMVRLKSLHPTKGKAVSGPDNVVAGDCGNTSLYVNQGPSSGYASFYQGFYSTHGGIVAINRTVQWANDTRGTQSSFSGGIPLSGYPVFYSRTDVKYTQTGHVHAVMSGTVITEFDVCGILFPTDNWNIT